MNKGLTTFRAFAFLAVFLFHAGGLGAGYLGVQAFFVLSGFLLTPILLGMKASLGTKDFFLHFYGRRTLRIFPLYYFYLAIVAFIAYTFSFQNGYVSRFFTQLPWAVTFTYDFFHASRYFQPTPLLAHFWSLAVEEQFYLVWPLAIFILPGKYIKFFLILTSFSGLLLRISIALFSLKYSVPFIDSKTDLVIYVLPFSNFDAFAIGGFFALYVKSRSSISVWLYILLVYVVGLTTSWLSTDNIDWLDLGYPSFMRDSYKYVWGYSVMNLLFAYILINVRDRKFMPFIFENGWLNYLGKISYGLYVYHYPITWIIYSIFDVVPGYIRIAVGLVVTIFISAISFELMEKRFIILKDKYFAKTQ